QRIFASRKKVHAIKDRVSTSEDIHCLLHSTDGLECYQNGLGNNVWCSTPQSHPSSELDDSFVCIDLPVALSCKQQFQTRSPSDGKYSFLRRLRNILAKWRSHCKPQTITIEGNAEASALDSP